MVLALATVGGSLQAAFLPGNIWPNPSLESVSSQAGIPTFWHPGGSEVSIDDWASDFSVSPVHSLKLDDASAADYGEWWSDRVKVTGGATYSLRYSLRYDTTGTMRVTANFADETGVRMSGVDFNFSGTQLDWEELTQSVTVPDGAKAMWLTFASGGSIEVTGTAWLDDISFANDAGETDTESKARILDAAYSTEIKIDGEVSDWENLSSQSLTMDTQGRGTNGMLAVDIQYAWNSTNLYILVKENPSYTVAKAPQEAPDADTYQNAPWAVDTIAFWMDLDNNAGVVQDGMPVVENNADFQPWFGFSSAGRRDLIYGRVNDSGSMNLDGFTNAKVATGGTFAEHNRRIEIAIAWRDVAAAVDPSRQPGGDVSMAVTPGFVFGSEPLLIYNDYNAQAFLGPDQWNPPSGVDTNSVDVRLISGAKVVDAAFSSEINVDGETSDWSNLSSGVITMDTQGRGANGTLAVDIQYAWNKTNLYILVKENAATTVARVQQEAADQAAYQAGPWAVDSVAFWIDLDNDAGTLKDGVLVVENNADFQPWFGFSSSGRTDLIYGRLNNSGTMNLDGLVHAKVATGGTFQKHDRRIEIAISWADMPAAVDPAQQPGGDIAQAIVTGFTFGSEPLLVYKDFNAQAFIGPDQWNPPSGADSDSRDIRLVDAAVPVTPPSLTIDAAGDSVVVRWPVSATGFVLETTGKLESTASWSQFAGEILVENEMNKAIVVSSGSAAFYRLRK
ncbi:MAG TPA: hypothetical protein P5186_19575 [Candidatus Paceibacterota bacterium]|nr:hypothetical protein [Verrucomicrobiota bacterium]HRY50259.1 hypothetical protein [Candidatus Paceibacterota bacterium]